MLGVWCLVLGRNPTPNTQYKTPVGDLFTIGPVQAAYAIRLLGISDVLPIHYATFPALTGTPEALREQTADIAGLNIHAIPPGESIRLAHS